MATRADVVREARTLVGVRWRHLGRSEAGVDCAGLLVVVGRRLGLLADDGPSYPRRPDGSFLDTLRSYGDPADPRLHREGDVMVFAQAGCPCHCGVATVVDGVPSVVHAVALRRVVVEESVESALSVAGRLALRLSFRGLEE